MLITSDTGGTPIKHGILTPQKGQPAFMVQDKVNSDARVLKGPSILHRVESLTVRAMRQDIKGIAISIAGMADMGRGHTQHTNDNVPEHTGLQFKQQLEARFHIPCWVESDVNAAISREAVFGAGKGAAHVLMLTTGTGIGGVAVINHTIYRGCSGSAEEIGYIWVMDHHFQDIASTTALVQRVETQTKEADLNGRIIHVRAKRGDAVYIQAVQEPYSHIAIGVSNCVCLMSPQAVILGDGIMTRKKLLTPLMETYLRQYMNEEVYAYTQLAFAWPGDRVEVAGACTHWVKQGGIRFA